MTRRPRKEATPAPDLCDKCGYPMDPDLTTRERTTTHPSCDRTPETELLKSPLRIKATYKLQYGWNTRRKRSP